MEAKFLCICYLVMLQILKLELENMRITKKRKAVIAPKNAKWQDCVQRKNLLLLEKSKPNILFYSFWYVQM